MYPSPLAVSSRHIRFMAAALGVLLGFAISGLVGFVEGLIRIAVLLARYAL